MKLFILFKENLKVKQATRHSFIVSYHMVLFQNQDGVTEWLFRFFFYYLQAFGLLTRKYLSTSSLLRLVLCKLYLGCMLSPTMNKAKLLLLLQAIGLGIQ